MFVSSSTCSWLIMSQEALISPFQRDVSRCAQLREKVKEAQKDRGLKAHEKQIN